MDVEESSVGTRGASSERRAGAVDQERAIEPRSWVVSGNIYKVREGKTIEQSLRTLLLHLNGAKCDYRRLVEDKLFCITPLDLHHALIKKSAWQGNPNVDYIHHPFNCCLICRRHHELYGQSEELRKILWKLQAERYGYDDLTRWLMDAPTETVDRFWLTGGYWTPMLN